MERSIENRIPEVKLLTAHAGIMEVVIGARATGYMLLMYRKKLQMRSWQNMRKEEVDEKVVLYHYVVSDDCIWDNRMHIKG
jgi:hypothetical protein